MTNDLLPRGDPGGFHQYGQKLYQHGDYVKAIEVFGQALRMKLPDLVGILDNRAATYCKLGNFELALRDAKQMIRTNRFDERGYLRSGKILLLNKKPDKALDMYAYGLKTLAADHPRRHLLQQLHDKLSGKMAAQFQDPFDTLPVELAVMILRHFDFKQTVAILRVSKKWERFLTSLRELWMCMDLSRAHKKVNISAIRAYIRRSKAMLTHVVLNNISLPYVDKTLELVSRCPNLEYFEARVPCHRSRFYTLFKESKRLRTLITSEDINLDQKHVGLFLTNLPLLERIECHGNNASPFSDVSWPAKLPNLRAIALGAQNLKPIIDHHQALHIPGMENGATVDSIPNLEELRVHWNPRMVRSPYLFTFDYRGFPNLRKLDVSGVDLHRLSDLPASLEHLRLHRCRHVGSIPFSETPDEIPNLKNLILTDNNWVTPVTIATLLRPSVRILYMDSCQRLTGNNNGLIAVCRQSTELEELNVSHLYNVDDTTAVSFLATFKALRVLHLSYTSISGLTIKAAADARVQQERMEVDGVTTTMENRKAKLQRMYIKGCDGVSPDAVAYGWARGIEIVT